MTAILEINDSDLTLYAGTEPVYRAPAVALVRRGDIRFGDAAWRLARMHPQQTVTHYFGRLNADPLPQPVPGAANHADLVYLHLQELAPLIDAETDANTELILAVPGMFSAEQLGVLLGICQEAGLTIVGFVDTAVAAASTTESVASSCYIDVHQQRFSLTHLQTDAAAGEIARTAAEEIPDSGFSSLMDGWVNVIADRFVRDTRFDPLHTAETEQQIYNQVFDWVTGPNVTQPDVTIEIDYRDQQRSTGVARVLLEEKARQRMAPLVERIRERVGTDTHLLLSARAARLPGLTGLFDRHGYAWSQLGDHACAEGIMSHRPLIVAADGNLRLVTRLPQTNVAAALIPRAAEPTHLLAGHHAMTVDDPDLNLPVERRHHTLWLMAGGDVLLNGKRPVADAQLRLGDEVRRGDDVFQLIHVAG